MISNGINQPGIAYTDWTRVDINTMEYEVLRTHIGSFIKACDYGASSKYS